MILYYRSVSLLFHMFNSQRFFPSDMGRVPCSIAATAIDWAVLSSATVHLSTGF